MIDISKLTIGQKVHYQPDHYKDEQYDNGMIKEIPDHTNTAVRVVFNCNDDWDNFMNYTSQLTNKSDLKLDWKNDYEETELYLYNADPNCKHEIISLWSGVKCKNCTGWYCS